MVKAVIGIDIGGTSTKLASISQEHKILERVTLDQEAYASEAEYFRLLFSTISSLIHQKASNYAISGIGIGAPSCLPEEGVIQSAANLPFSERVEIVKILEEEYNLPVFLIKDSNAAALGEGLFGAAKGMGNYLMLTLGTGLGCSMVINNRLVTGYSGKAGELGHTIIRKDGRDCGCGRKGCLETYVSATGIKRTLFQLLASSNLESELRDVTFNALSPKMIFEAAQGGDSIAQFAFQETGQILGEKLAEIVALIEPEAIFLAGGLADAGDLLFAPAIKQMNLSLLDSYKNKIKILHSSLSTNEAALLGAGSLVWTNKSSTKYSLPCR